MELLSLLKVPWFWNTLIQNRRDWIITLHFHDFFPCLNDALSQQLSSKLTKGKLYLQQYTATQLQGDYLPLLLCPSLLKISCPCFTRRGEELNSEL